MDFIQFYRCFCIQHIHNVQGDFDRVDHWRKNVLARHLLYLIDVKSSVIVQRGKKHESKNKSHRSKYGTVY